jgi:hypothetical protein
MLKIQIMLKKFLNYLKYQQIKELCGKALQDPESSECISNLEALQAYLEESSESDTSLQLG